MRESNFTWSEYRLRFEQKATDFGHPLARIEGLLLYAEKLYRLGLPVIHDARHLSFLTGFRTEYIQRAITRPGNFYRSFKIAKKNGNSRTITEPLPGLKEIQYWILENIIKKLPPNKLNNAYLAGRSIVSNAKFHARQPKVLNIDIEKYFDHIAAAEVTGLMLSLGYNAEVSKLIAQLITLNDGLPQGSPTSPYLSSVITKKIDVELLEYCQQQGLRYSRYADDISISGEFDTEQMIGKVREVLGKNGFTMNSRKTTLKKQHQRQMVTGIVVNRKLSIKKSLIKQLRQEVYYILRFGLENHLLRRKINRRNYLNVLEGKLHYYDAVKKKDANLSYIRSALKEIKLRESMARLRDAFDQ